MPSRLPLNSRRFQYNWTESSFIKIISEQRHVGRRVVAYLSFYLTADACNIYFQLQTRIVSSFFIHLGQLNI